MSRDGMPRAYLRIDPNIDQVHPDVNAFVRLLCVAARQPDRGRFRNRELLQALLGKSRVHAMFARGDVEVLPDGRVYVVGWDEWQEGDHTVAERMHRMRERRKRRDGHVTAPPSQRRNDVTTDAGTTDVEVLHGVGDSVGVTPPPPVGRRKDGTNPRALGTNPRANGTSPRQEREGQKRAPTRLHEILTAIQKGDA